MVLNINFVYCVKLIKLKLKVVGMYICIISVMCVMFCFVRVGVVFICIIRIFYLLKMN